MHPRRPGWPRELAVAALAAAAVYLGARLGIEAANFLWINDIGGVRTW